MLFSTPRCSSYWKRSLQVALDYSWPTYLSHLVHYLSFFKLPTKKKTKKQNKLIKIKKRKVIPFLVGLWTFQQPLIIMSNRFFYVSSFLCNYIHTRENRCVKIKWNLTVIQRSQLVISNQVMYLLWCWKKNMRFIFCHWSHKKICLQLLLWDYLPLLLLHSLLLFHWTNLPP